MVYVSSKVIFIGSSCLSSNVFAIFYYSDFIQTHSSKDMNYFWSFLLFFFLFYSDFTHTHNVLNILITSTLSFFSPFVFIQTTYTHEVLKIYITYTLSFFSSFFLLHALFCIHSISIRRALSHLEYIFFM